MYGYLAPLQAKLSYYRENEYEYEKAVADAKVEIYDEISSRAVVICEFPELRYREVKRIANTAIVINPLVHRFVSYFPFFFKHSFFSL